MNITPRLSARLKMAVFGILFLLAQGCASVYYAPKPANCCGPNPPLFQDAYAPARINSGAIWRVYIDGYDPDADMKDLYIEVSQLEGERWYKQFLPLPAGLQQHFRGYLSLRIPYFNGTSTVLMKVMIRDWGGHKSPVIEQKVEIGYAGQDILPQRWADAANNEIGAVHFKVRDPNAGHESLGRVYRR